MDIKNKLHQRSDSSCELCASKDSLQVYEVQPSRNGDAADCILVCSTCCGQFEDSENLNTTHWRCLNDSMWSQVPAVQAMAYRMLNRLSKESWALELLDMMYLDEETLTWAKSGLGGIVTTDKIIHLDSNGVILEAGDTVVLIQDLKVKGANFTAKRGTAVRRISLVPDNPEHIEGKVDGQHIVILTKFVKKMK